MHKQSDKIISNFRKKEWKSITQWTTCQFTLISDVLHHVIDAIQDYNTQIRITVIAIATPCVQYLFQILLNFEMMS